MAQRTIKVADKPTLDRVAHALGVAENKIYGLKIAKNNSNPATRCTYLLDAEGTSCCRIAVVLCNLQPIYLILSNT